MQEDAQTVFMCCGISRVLVLELSDTRLTLRTNKQDGNRLEWGRNPGASKRMTNVGSIVTKLTFVVQSDGNTVRKDIIVNFKGVRRRFKVSFFFFFPASTNHLRLPFLSMCSANERN